MHARDLGGNVETEAEALLAGANLPPEERLEQLCQQLSGNSCAGVGDRELERAVDGWRRRR